MDKIYRKQNRKSGYINNIGKPIGIHDKNGNELCYGDIVKYGDEECILLGNQALLTRSKWYGDDKYNPKSYGKAYDLHLDNGARMEIEKIFTGGR